MKTVVTLALAAGRKYQSKETGYIHFQDVIPIYENFCFILALFRSHMSDSVLEGKALLEKLFHFEVAGQFPVNLHEYPQCRDPSLNHKIHPIFFWLYKDFGSLLGPHLREKVLAFLDHISLKEFKEPYTPDDWAQNLILAQMTQDVDLAHQAARMWHPELRTFIGHQAHSGAEPAVTLYDLFMGEMYGEFSKRALRPHLCHLRGALVQPFDFVPEKRTLSPYIQIEKNGIFIGWGSSECLHTFVSYQEFVKEGEEYLVKLPVEVPPENENEEVVFYCNAHEENFLLVNGKKATSFQLNDVIQMHSKGMTLELSFEAEGLFTGFIAKAIRPRQPKINQFVAFDWKFGLRTLRRHSHCLVVCKLRLSSASPMMLSP